MTFLDGTCHTGSGSGFNVNLITVLLGVVLGHRCQVRACATLFFSVIHQNVFEMTQKK